MFLEITPHTNCKSPASIFHINPMTKEKSPIYPYTPPINTQTHTLTLHKPHTRGSAVRFYSLPRLKSILNAHTLSGKNIKSWNVQCIPRGPLLPSAPPLCCTGGAGAALAFLTLTAPDNWTQSQVLGCRCTSLPSISELEHIHKN